MLPLTKRAFAIKVVYNDLSKSVKYKAACKPVFNAHNKSVSSKNFCKPTCDFLCKIVKSNVAFKHVCNGLSKLSKFTSKAARNVPSKNVFISLSVRSLVLISLFVYSCSRNSV